MENNISEVLPDLPIPAEPIDMEAVAEQYRRDAILRDRVAYYETRTPPAYKNFDPRHPGAIKNGTAIDSVLGWKRGPKGLLLSGKTHRCKSRVAYALCKRLLIEDVVDVRMWHMQDFFTELQGNVYYGRDVASDFIKRLSEAPVVFLDDYGQESVQTGKQEWAQGWLFNLLQKRIGNGLPMIITTNLTSVQISTDSTDPKSDPFVSRLLDVAEPIKFT